MEMLSRNKFVKKISTRLFVSLCFLVLIAGIKTVYAEEKQLLFVYGDERIADFSMNYFEKNGVLNGYRLHKIFHGDFSPDLYKIEKGAVVISLGTAPAITIAKSGVDLPVYALFLTQTAYRFIQSQYGEKQNIIPFYLDQPLERQARFVRKLFPEAKNIAVLFGPASIKLKSKLDSSFANKKFNVEFEIVDEDDNVAKALERLLSHRYPVLSIADSIAVSPNNSKWLLYMAYQRNIPVIGFSSSFTRAGALASIFSTPEQVLQYFSEEFPSSQQDHSKKVGRYFPKYYSIEVNDSVARSLKIDLPNKRDIVSAIEEGN